MLSRLIYSSRTGHDLDFQEIEAILLSARRHNMANDITGLLLCGNRSFLQVLEGDRTLVSETYSRIVVDPRHGSHVLAEFCEINERYFSNWTMKLVMFDQLATPKAAAILLRFGASGKFNPLQMNAASALQLLREISSITGD